jgi:hypothetical protein
MPYFPLFKGFIREQQKGWGNYKGLSRIDLFQENHLISHKVVLDKLKINIIILL